MQFLLRLYGFFARRRGLLFALLALCVLLMCWPLSRLRFQEDIYSFLPQDKQPQGQSFVSRQLAEQGKWILMLSPASAPQDQALQDKAARGVSAQKMSAKNERTQAPDYARWTAAADSLAAFLRQDPEVAAHFTEIFYRLETDRMMAVPEALARALPLYMEEADYARLDSLFERQPLDLLLDSLLAGHKALLFSPASAFLGPYLRLDPLQCAAPALDRLKGLQPGAGYPRIRDCLFARDTSALLLFVSTDLSSGQTGENEALCRHMERAVAYVAGLDQGAWELRYFSGAAVGVDNARAIQRDTALLVSLSLAVIILLLWAFFRTLRPVLFISLPVLFGLVLALGLMGLLQGGVSAIAMGALGAVVGIALNYSLHYLIHRCYTDSEEQTLAEVGFPMLTGCVTTVAAFLALCLIPASALRDFGLLAAFALVGSILFVVLFFPHFRPVRRIPRPTPFSRAIDRFSAYSPEVRPALVWTVVGLTLFLGCFMSRTGFDVNLHHINYLSPAQSQAMERARTLSYALEQSRHWVSPGATLEEALQGHEAARPLLDSALAAGALRSVAGVGGLCPSQKCKAERLARWEAYWQGRPDFAPALLQAGERARFKPAYFQPFLSLLDPAHCQSLLAAPQDPALARLCAHYILQDGEAAAVLDLVAEADPAPTEVPGQALQPLDSLVARVPGAFLYSEGALASALVQSLHNSFDTVLWVCSLLVFGFLWLSYRSLLITLLCFLPMAVGWVWILGVMGLCGLDFNVVNVILASFIFGVGDDYSLFMMEGILHEYRHGKKMLASYKTAVTLSALILLVGLGCLVFARHPAMRSLGVVSVIGMLSVILISYTLAPALLRWILYRKGKPREVPLCLSNVLRTVFVFAAFLVLAAGLTVEGFLRLRLVKATPQRKLRFHQRVQKTLAWCVQRFPGVSYQQLGAPAAELGRQSEVWVANHQSHLDLLYLLALSPKVVAMTNRWVWRSPFYGAVIRFLDYYPLADQGLENGLELLKEKVAQGYSLLIFPEGKRSPQEGEILKFHQGAFYLARALGIPLRPLTLSGPGVVLPKEEWVLRQGEVLLHIGPAQDLDPEGTTRVDAKAWRRHFRQNYAKVRSQAGPDFEKGLQKGRRLYQKE